MRLRELVSLLLAGLALLLAQTHNTRVDVDRLRAIVSLRVPAATAPQAAYCDSDAEMGNVVD